MQKEAILIESDEREQLLREELNAKYESLALTKEQEYKELFEQVKLLLGSLSDSTVVTSADSLISRVDTLRSDVEDARKNVAY